MTQFVKGYKFSKEDQLPDWSCMVGLDALHVYTMYCNCIRSHDLMCQLQECALLLTCLKTC